MIRSLFAFCLMMVAAGPNAFAHEYYLQPDAFSPAAGTTVKVSHKLGQRFKGNEMPWIDKWNVRSEVWHNGEMKQVKGLDGDRPALSMRLENPGLYTVVHQSNIDTLTFKTYEKFKNYVTKEGMEHSIAASENGSKPKVGLKEAYSRFAKTLILADGETKALDKPVGLKIELVALANPYGLAADQPMPVQVLYEGKPLVGVSVKVFEGIGLEPAYHVRTDADGKASIKPAGIGPYLIGAIHMTEPQSEEAKSKDVHWESFWASLTFKRAQ